MSGFYFLCSVINLPGKIYPTMPPRKDTCAPDPPATLKNPRCIGTPREVFEGLAMRTGKSSTSMRKADLMKNPKTGAIVSRKASEAAAKRYKAKGIGGKKPGKAKDCAKEIREAVKDALTDRELEEALEAFDIEDIAKPKAAAAKPKAAAAKPKAAAAKPKAATPAAPKPASNVVPLSAGPKAQSAAKKLERWREQSRKQVEEADMDDALAEVLQDIEREQPDPNEISDEALEEILAGDDDDTGGSLASHRRRRAGANLMRAHRGLARRYTRPTGRQARKDSRFLHFRQK